MQAFEEDTVLHGLLPDARMLAQFPALQSAVQNFWFPEPGPQQQQFSGACLHGPHPFDEQPAFRQVAWLVASAGLGAAIE